MTLRNGLAVLLACACPQLYAVEPAEATLKLDQLEVSYGGGPFVNANVVHQTSLATGNLEPTCMPPLLECDEFALTLDFPADIIDVYPTAIVRFQFEWVDITGAGVIDFDFFIMDEDGNVVSDGAASSSNPEAVTMLLEGGLVSYRVVGVPFLALGDSYTAKIEVDLGEPVETQGRSVLVGNSAGGALGWGLLMLLGLGLQRRR